MIERTEWAVAIVLTLLAAAIHIVNLRAAGGLWRDEAAGVALAAMPSFADVWSHLEHESFPLLITVLLRGWSSLGFGFDDAGLRIFGLLIGLCVLAAVWWAAWRFSSSAPLLSLLLFAFSPTLIRWGDSVRAYGLGVFFVLLTFAAVWRAMQLPSRRTQLLAMLAGLLAVQTLYPNAVMLAVICLSGALLTWKGGGLRSSISILAIGIPAALSLVPYRGVISRANEWNEATQTNVDLARIWLVLHRALSDRGPLLLWLWVVLACLALASGYLLAKRNGSVPNDNNNAARFLVVTTALTVVAFYMFLKQLRFPSEVWYYLVPIGIVAIAIDALIARAVRDNWLRLARLLLVVLAVALSFSSTLQAVRVRMTNLDLVAQRLTETAATGDLILIHPWFCGATMSRYYKGSAELMTLPPLADLHLQRLDLFKEQMKLDDPLAPVRAQIEATLRSGHTLWLVGYFPFGNPPRPPPKLPRAGEGPEGWRAAPYMTVYGMDIAYFLQQHAGASAALSVPLNQPVNPFENFPVRSVRGWH
jgi:uncharacterized membrane protein